MQKICIFKENWNFSFSSYFYFVFQALLMLFQRLQMVFFLRIGKTFDSKTEVLNGSSNDFREKSR